MSFPSNDQAQPRRRDSADVGWSALLESFLFILETRVIFTWDSVMISIHFGIGTISDKIFCFRSRSHLTAILPTITFKLCLCVNGLCVKDWLTIRSGRFDCKLMPFKYTRWTLPNFLPIVSPCYKTDNSK